jgi:hypothetical protein
VNGDTMTTGSEQKSVAPNCKRCGQPTHLLTTIPKFDKHPTYRIFQCVPCQVVEWVADL